MSRTSVKSKRTFFLVLSMTSNLGLLILFKYLNFFGENLNVLFANLNIFYQIPLYNYLLPVGISFYTFQTMSYTIDVYSGKMKAEKHFGIFALYVSFFPQLVAGPIERATRLLPQFYVNYKFDYIRIRNGLLLMVWGFFKKVVIADRVSEYVNAVYNNVTDFGGLQDIIATVFFGIQIYCDFSGYSDIAIGSAMVLGYELMTNFRRPYLARSIREFWQRWHISLSTWFRDYLYIPLGGNRVVRWRWYYNLFITFLVSGLWHGANWTFIIWGALHGFYLLAAIVTLDWRNRNAGRIGITPGSRLESAINLFWTFILVYFAWIFFRANSLNDALLIMGNIVDFSTYNTNIQLFAFASDFYLSFALVGILIITEILIEKYDIVNKHIYSSSILKWIILLALLFAIFVLGKWDENDFLYFQF
jgi:D-alanyl-lipoteichoic acid acyltransferase DltB (MBOAT superfamily)